MPTPFRFDARMRCVLYCDAEEVIGIEESLRLDSMRWAASFVRIHLLAIHSY